MKQSGAALMLVLWLIALLAALVGAFALTARVEALQGRTLSAGGRAAEIARAGLEYALVRVADSDPVLHWRPDGRPYRWRFDGAELEIRIVDETGKVDLNTADVALLTALLRHSGVEPAQAARLAAAIADWRDTDPLTQPSGGAEDPDYAAAGLAYGAKDAPFETVAEVEQVLGMTPEIYARLEPSLTVFTGAPPNPAYAQGPVLAALGMEVQAALDQRLVAPPHVGTGSGTYSIESRARLDDGRTAMLRSVVRNGGGPAPGMAYAKLRWNEGGMLQDE